VTPETPTLWERVRAATSRGLAAGALQPIPTTFETVEDGGIPFQLRIVDNPRRKTLQRQRVGQRPRAGDADPFLPHDEDLYVADLGPSHLLLLNKFNVLEHHLLIVTRAFADQEELPDEADLAALWHCLGGIDGLGFYNGGEAAGASQPHKHLQLVPYPLAPGLVGAPIEAVFGGAEPAGDVLRLPALPFRHALLRLDGLPVDPAAAAPRLHAQMLTLLDAIGLGPRPDAPTARQAGPYNLLITRNWMLAVPRSREKVGSIGVNAIGFAGGLLVRDEAERDQVRTMGPRALLCQVVT